MRSLCFGVVVLALFGACGRSRGGGIVDNGNHVPAPKGDPSAKDPNGTVTLQGLSILEHFTIDLPDGGWKLISDTSALDQTILANETERMLFSWIRPDLACEVSPFRSDSGTLLSECSDIDTILEVEGFEPVFVRHSQRSQAIQNILKSFRQR